MIYAKDGSDAQPDGFTRHSSPPSHLPLNSYRQAQIVDDGILNYGKLATGWWKRPETMDGTHKGRMQCTGRGKRTMWTALFFPLGFDEVANDSGYGREQTEKDQRYTISLRLSSYAENYWKASRQPRFYLVSHGHPPSLEGTHI